MFRQDITFVRQDNTSYERLTQYLDSIAGQFDRIVLHVEKLIRCFDKTTILVHII